jgi:hypothetical protein
VFSSPPTWAAIDGSSIWPQPPASGVMAGMLAPAAAALVVPAIASARRERIT